MEGGEGEEGLGWMEREGVMGGQQEERRDGRGRGGEERRGGEEGRGGHGVFFMLETHELFSIWLQFDLHHRKHHFNATFFACKFA